MVMFFALGLSLVCSFIALALGLHAAARVARFQKSTRSLNWDDVANLTGDVVSVRATLQKLNNRINGMERVKSGTQANAITELELARQNRQTPVNEMWSGG